MTGRILYSGADLVSAYHSHPTEHENKDLVNG